MPPTLISPLTPSFSLEGPGSVAAALGVLAGIIFVHELGHFSAARALGVHVTKFAVGFGPRLLSFKDAEVEYSLGLIPLGGFVAFPDDDPDSPWPADDPDLLRNRPLADRAGVVVAGVVANVVCAFALLTTQALTVGQLELTYLPGVKVPTLLGVSAAQRAGVRAGDIIMAVDGQPVTPTADSVGNLVDKIKYAAGRPIAFTIARPGETAPLLIDVTPDAGSSGGRIGVQLEGVCWNARMRCVWLLTPPLLTRPSANSRTTHRVAEGLPQALRMAASDFARLTGVVTHGLAEIVLNFENTVDQISGPVAIVAVGAQVARGDSAGIFQFASIININLAVVNLLPLPALDGGFLALLALEGARGGKKLPVEVEQTIMGSGLLLLFASGVVLLVRDTLNLDFVRTFLQ